jgi:hypothetical protein
MLKIVQHDTYVVIPDLFRNLDAFDEYVKILNTFVLINSHIPNIFGNLLF